MIVSFAEEMNPTKRNTMEDTHAVEIDLLPNVDFVGVYDGHGGRDIADFVETALHENIKEELMFQDEPDADEEEHKAALCQDSEGASIEERIERAFLITDIQSHMAGLATSGATAAICLMDRRRQQQQQQHVTLYGANVGDARVVLYHNQTPHRLTHDHKSDCPEEEKRIQNAGGFVLRGRVLGILAVARSFGDHGMKQFIIGKPYISKTEITLNQPNEDEQENNDSSSSASFCICACDGLWDVLSDQQACDFVVDCLKNKITREMIAQKLCDEAIKLGSTDNITVIVSWL
mmetsp:Transcript_1647/g.2637  ORF Transcript_1647/g.2637 Transcript_1647/m.2637 type:complete len:291 (+) Transcript_1647:179-1051(+)